MGGSFRKPAAFKMMNDAFFYFYSDQSNFSLYIISSNIHQEIIYTPSRNEIHTSYQYP